MEFAKVNLDPAVLNAETTLKPPRRKLNVDLEEFLLSLEWFQKLTCPMVIPKKSTRCSGKLYSSANIALI